MEGRARGDMMEVGMGMRCRNLRVDGLGLWHVLGCAMSRELFRCYTGSWGRLNDLLSMIYGLRIFQCIVSWEPFCRRDIICA